MLPAEKIKDRELNPGRPELVKHLQTLDDTLSKPSGRNILCRCLWINKSFTLLFRWVVLLFLIA